MMNHMREYIKQLIRDDSIQIDIYYQVYSGLEDQQNKSSSTNCLGGIVA